MMKAHAVIPAADEGRVFFQEPTPGKETGWRGKSSSSRLCWLFFSADDDKTAV
jgi:hypothetical protein